MTTKLVGLISAVLLLCLGAFALLMNYYQGQVREEVARTISEVGQATIRTLEAGPQIYGWHQVSPSVGKVRVETGWIATDGDDVDTVVLQFDGDEGMLEMLPDEHGFFITHQQERSTGGPEEETIITNSTRTVRLPRVVRKKIINQIEGDQKILNQVEGDQQFTAQIMVHVDEVATVRGPAREIFLKIPTTEVGSGADEMTRAAGEESTAAVARALLDPPGALHRKDLLLSVDTKDYDNLFASMGVRSGTAFLAVFLLGTALSAGLASRFTRPVRRLDSAIRALSAGDMEAAVGVTSNDEIGRLSSAFNDMTRSLRAHEQRSRELTRREKLSALGQLAAGVAHDVRNPLHSIGLTLEHMREATRPEDAGRGEEFDRSLEIIKDEISRLDTLVGNFLRFTRAEKSEPVPVAAGILLEDTANLVEKEAQRRKIRISLELEEDLPQVMADGEALRSSILNLVLNSFEAMPSGGQLHLSAVSDDSAVAIEVRDDGRGIPLEDQERAFDFAYTTKESGHGLGLAMVHQIVVEEHGGSIQLTSDPQTGTQVRLLLPLPEGAQA